MLLAKRKNLLISIAIIMVVSVVSFLGLSALTKNSTSAQENNLVSETKVNSIQEASNIAGYSVATLNFSLAGFDVSQTSTEIYVVQLYTYTRGPESRLVEQYWTLKDGSWFTLVQLPRPGESVESIPSGSQVTIGSLMGKREYLEGDDRVPSRVVFRWYNGGMRYALVGSLTESITEEILINFAKTVGIQ